MNAWFWSKRKVITMGREPAIANMRKRNDNPSLFFHKKLFKILEVNMGYSISKIEQETTINFNAAEKIVYIDTIDPVVIRKLGNR